MPADIKIGYDNIMIGTQELLNSFLDYYILQYCLNIIITIMIYAVGIQEARMESKKNMKVW